MGGDTKAKSSSGLNITLPLVVSKIFISIFFAVHYSFFHLGYLIFLIFSGALSYLNIEGFSFMSFGGGIE